MNAFHRLHNLRMENDAVKFRMEELAPQFEALRTRHETGTAPRAVSAFNLFQTPTDLAERLVELANPQAGFTALEPSAGLGRILNALNGHKPAEITAIEIAPQLAGVLYSEWRNIRLLQRDFLTVQPEETGLFDVVAMNPPFHMRADIEHIRHALKFVKSGGHLVALCMNTRHRAEALQNLADHWEELPAGCFKSEGTGISAVMLRIRKD